MRIDLESPVQLTPKQIKALDVYAFFSAKLDRDVMCIGEANYRLGIWLEGQASVRAYSERPFSETAPNVHADFIAVHAKKGQAVERVVWASQRAKGLDHDQVSARFAAEREASFERFNDRSSAALRCEVDNLLEMHPFVVEHHRRPDEQAEKHISERIAGGRCSLLELQQTGCNDAGILRAAFWLHFNGRVSIDMSIELSLDSLVGEA